MRMDEVVVMELGAGKHLKNSLPQHSDGFQNFRMVVCGVTNGHSHHLIFYLWFFETSITMKLTLEYRFFVKVSVLSLKYRFCR